MNSFSLLYEYDLEIGLHQRGLYQTQSFCRNVFKVKSQLKNTWHLKHLIENTCGYQLYIFVTSFFFFLEHAPIVLSASAWTHHFHAKCTTRILQLAHQDLVVPAESAAHPHWQNPVYTYSVHLIAIAPFAFTREITVCTILQVSGD